MLRSAIIIVILVLSTASCASTGAGGRPANEREYRSDIDTVIEKAGGVLDELHLNVEDQGWAVEGERYEISAYELNRVFQGSEGTVRSASVLVVIEQVAPGQVRAVLRTSRRQAPAMAGSAGRTVDHERAFFNRLDDILPLVLPEDTQPANPS